MPDVEAIEAGVFTEKESALIAEYTARLDQRSEGLSEKQSFVSTDIEMLKIAVMASVPAQEQVKCLQAIADIQLAYCATRSLLNAFHRNQQRWR